MARQRDAKDARFIDLQHQGALTGQRMRVRFAPEDAIASAVDQLVLRGFAVRPIQGGGEPASSGADAEGWHSRAVELGDRKKSWRRGVIADVVEEFLPVDLIPGLRRGIAPTLVVIAARPLAPGDTELVVMPIASKQGDPQAAFGAAPIVRDAIEATRVVAEQAGALIEVDAPSLGIADPSCPASRAGAHARFGWPA